MDIYIYIYKRKEIGIFGLRKINNIFLDWKILHLKDTD